MDRFWNKTKARSDGCLMWQGALQPNGYGRFKMHGKAELAHRVAWMLAHGKEPDKQVCHTCDNPGCVSPEHLFVGTQSDNMQDCVRKGRHASPDLSKLKVSDVPGITNLVKQYSYRRVARMLGVDESTVRNYVLKHGLPRHTRGGYAVAV